MASSDQTTQEGFAAALALTASTSRQPQPEVNPPTQPRPAAVDESSNDVPLSPEKQSPLALIERLLVGVSQGSRYIYDQHLNINDIKSSFQSYVVMTPGTLVDFLNAVTSWDEKSSVPLVGLLEWRIKHEMGEPFTVGILEEFIHALENSDTEFLKYLRRTVKGRQILNIASALASLRRAYECVQQTPGESMRIIGAPFIQRVSQLHHN